MAKDKEEAGGGGEEDGDWVSYVYVITIISVFFRKRSKRQEMTTASLLFPILAVLLLPFQQMPGQHVHHLDAAEVFELLLRSRRRALAVCHGHVPGDCASCSSFAGGGQLLVCALHRWRLIAIPVSVWRRRALAADGHLDLHARDEFQNRSNPSFHLVH